MEETQQLERAIADTEARIALVQAARVALVKQELVEVERQLAELESSEARLRAAIEDLPKDADQRPWWLIGPLLAFASLQSRADRVEIVVSLVAWLVAFLVAYALAGRTK